MKKGTKALIISSISVLVIGAIGGLALFFRYNQVMSTNGFVEKEITLCVGEELELPVKRELVGYTWTTSDPMVAQVGSGSVSAGSAGTCTVTAKKYWYEFMIEVGVREHEAIPGTCDTPTICQKCNRVLEPAPGHDFSAPTCTEDSRCLRCGITGEEKALGHDGNEATCTEASVCRVCNQQLARELGHSFCDATCTEDSKCVNCGITGSWRARGHAMEEATCTEAAKCSRCEYTEGEALGHVAPQSKDCSRDMLCERCEVIITPAGSHDFAEATCKKPKTCKVCGKTEGRKLGHSFTEATCTEKAKCERCGVETGSFAPHYYVEVENNRSICAYCGVEKPSYSTGSGTGESSSVDAGEWANRVLELINEERAAVGLGPMVMDATLVEVANIRANEIVQSFSHTRPDGRDCFTAYDECGVHYRSAGENIAAGQRSPEAVMEDWMNSPGHRANILKSGFGRVGIGVVTTQSGYKYYWVQNFAN